MINQQRWWIKNDVQDNREEYNDQSYETQSLGQES